MTAKLEVIVRLLTFLKGATRCAAAVPRAAIRSCARDRKARPPRRAVRGQARLLSTGCCTNRAEGFDRCSRRSRRREFGGSRSRMEEIHAQAAHRGDLQPRPYPG